MSTAQAAYPPGRDFVNALGELTADEVVEALHLCRAHNWLGDITVRMSMTRQIMITPIVSQLR